MAAKSEELLNALVDKLNVHGAAPQGGVAVRRTQPSYVDRSVRYDMATPMGNPVPNSADPFSLSVWVADYSIYALANVHQVLLKRSASRAGDEVAGLLLGDMDVALLAINSNLKLVPAVTRAGAHWLEMMKTGFAPPHPRPFARLPKGCSALRHLQENGIAKYIPAFNENLPIYYLTDDMDVDLVENISQLIQLSVSSPNMPLRTLAAQVNNHQSLLPNTVELARASDVYYPGNLLPFDCAMRAQAVLAAANSPPPPPAPGAPATSFTSAPFHPPPPPPAPSTTFPTFSSLAPPPPPPPVPTAPTTSSIPAPASSSTPRPAAFPFPISAPTPHAGLGTPVPDLEVAQVNDAMQAMSAQIGELTAALAQYSRVPSLLQPAASGSGVAPTASTSGVTDSDVVPLQASKLQALQRQLQTSLQPHHVQPRSASRRQSQSCHEDDDGTDPAVFVGVTVPWGPAPGGESDPNPAPQLLQLMQNMLSTLTATQARVANLPDAYAAMEGLKQQLYNLTPAVARAAGLMNTPTRSAPAYSATTFMPHPAVSATSYPPAAAAAAAMHPAATTSLYPTATVPGNTAAPYSPYTHVANNVADLQWQVSVGILSVDAAARTLDFLSCQDTGGAGNTDKARAVTLLYFMMALIMCVIQQLPGFQEDRKFYSISLDTLAQNTSSPAQAIGVHKTLYMRMLRAALMSDLIGQWTLARFHTYFGDKVMGVIQGPVGRWIAMNPQATPKQLLEHCDHQLALYVANDSHAVQTTHSFGNLSQAQSRDLVQSLTPAQQQGMARHLIQAGVDMAKVQERMAGRNINRGKSGGAPVSSPAVMAATTVVRPAHQAPAVGSRSPTPPPPPRQPRDASNVVCHACQQKGHFWRQCPKPSAGFVPPTSNRPVFAADTPDRFSVSAPAVAPAAPSTSAAPAGYTPPASYKAVGFTYTNSKPAVYPHKFDNPAVNTCIAAVDPDLSMLLLLGGDVEVNPGPVSGGSDAVLGACIDATCFPVASEHVVQSLFSMAATHTVSARQLMPVSFARVAGASVSRAEGSGSSVPVRSRLEDVVDRVGVVNTAAKQLSANISALLGELVSVLHGGEGQDHEVVAAALEQSLAAMLDGVVCGGVNVDVDTKGEAAPFVEPTQLSPEQLHDLKCSLHAVAFVVNESPASGVGVVVGSDAFVFPKVMLDCGSMAFLIDKAIAQAIGMELEEYGTRIRTADRVSTIAHRSAQPVSLVVAAGTQYQMRVRFKHRWLVVDNAPFTALLGTPFLHAVGAIVRYDLQCLVMQPRMLSHGDLSVKFSIPITSLLPLPNSAASLPVVNACMRHAQPESVDACDEYVTVPAVVPVLAAITAVGGRDAHPDLLNAPCVAPEPRPAPSHEGVGMAARDMLKLCGDVELNPGPPRQASAPFGMSPVRQAMAIMNEANARLQLNPRDGRALIQLHRGLENLMVSARDLSIAVVSVIANTPEATAALLRQPPSLAPHCTAVSSSPPTADPSSLPPRSQIPHPHRSSSLFPRSQIPHPPRSSSLSSRSSSLSPRSQIPHPPRSSSLPISDPIVDPPPDAAAAAPPAADLFLLHLAEPSPPFMSDAATSLASTDPAAHAPAAPAELAASAPVTPATAAHASPEPSKSGSTADAVTALSCNRFAALDMCLEFGQFGGDDAEPVASDAAAAARPVSPPPASMPHVHKSVSSSEGLGPIPVGMFPGLYNDLCNALAAVLHAQQVHGGFPNPYMRQLYDRIGKASLQAEPLYRPRARAALGDWADVLNIVKAIGGDEVWRLIMVAFTAALAAMVRDHPEIPLVWMDGLSVVCHPYWKRWLRDAMECALLPLCQFAHVKWVRAQPHRARESVPVVPVEAMVGNECRLSPSGDEGRRAVTAPQVAAM